MQKILVAGGGIGGLAAAVACARAGCAVDLLEQAAAFSEVGAGLQLGPNATRILQAWGLGDALAAVASEPDAVRVRSARDDRTLGRLPLGTAMRQRYGAPYFCVHRADLHGVLLQGARALGATLHLHSAIKNVAACAQSVSVSIESGTQDALARPAGYQADALVGADGIWSVVRQHLLGDGPPQSTGHLAWRGLLDPVALPAAVSPREVSVWLGPAMHMVCYPVRGGRLINLVLISAGHSPGDPRDWSQHADPARLQTLVDAMHATPAAVVRAVAEWKLWALNVRPPVPSAAAMARGRVALLGDASHAMRPYLAQGGAMAIEDAAQLGQCLRQAGADLPAALQAYAQARWQRNARVQKRSQRNGRIFHASGPLRLARDMAMRLGGTAMLDSPWLYGHCAGLS